MSGNTIGIKWAIFEAISIVSERLRPRRFELNVAVAILNAKFHF